MFFLLALTALFLVIRINIQNSAVLNSTSRTNSVIQWQQPDGLKRDFPQAISNRQWSFNYSNVERIIWHSGLNNDKSFNIDKDTLKLLEKINAELTGFNNTGQSTQSPLNKDDLARIRFLIEQDVEQIIAKKLADLVIRYYQYHQENQMLINNIKQATNNDKINLLKSQLNNQVLMQLHHFGEVDAVKLFSNKNSQTDYFNQRLINVLSEKNNNKNNINNQNNNNENN